MLLIDPMTIFWIVIITVSVGITWEFIFSPLKAFPGPLLARFTDSFRSYQAMTGKADLKGRQWHEKWGPAVRVGPNTISLSDPELIRVVYTTRNPWLKSDMYRPNDVLVDGKRVSNLFNTADVNFHAKYKKPIRGLWTLEKILHLEPYMDETVEKLTKSLMVKFAGGNTGRVCQMDDWVTYYAWDTAGNMTFATDYGMLDNVEDVRGMHAESEAGLKYFAAVSQIPWIDNWLDKSPIFRLGPRPLVNSHLYTLNKLREHGKATAEGTYQRSGPPPFIENVYQLKKTHPDVADDDQVLNWLILNVIAGGDSVAGALRAIMYALGKNPDKVAKLCRELDAAALSMPAQWKDISRLPYLDAVVRESLRWNPALGLMLERYVPEGGMHLPDGRLIPAGTKVGLNPSIVNMDKAVFGDDAVLFRPERWLQQPGESDEEFRPRLRMMQNTGDFSFGHGARVCMGKWMAKLEMYKLVATLYSTFDIKMPDVNHEWKYCNSWFMYHMDIPMVLNHRRQATCDTES